MMSRKKKLAPPLRGEKREKKSSCEQRENNTSIKEV
jgi:hypothetical protein